MRKRLIGVMGPGATATAEDLTRAFELGRLIAQHGWILLTGGRNEGIMEAASRGAKSCQGLTVGILPGDEQNDTSSAVDIAILSGMGSARNNINVLSSDVIIACGMGLGTASEVALALKAKKSVILLTDNEYSKVFFKGLGKEFLYLVDNPFEAANFCQKILAAKHN
ncbi:MAG TPA: TIGR00725 family protein [Gammaproteobacteria bacterium]|nr:TIGR00725 family protein [Gammaproteobacteria bacterium]